MDGFVARRGWVRAMRFEVWSTRKITESSWRNGISAWTSQAHYTTPFFIWRLCTHPLVRAHARKRSAIQFHSDIRPLFKMRWPCWKMPPPPFLKRGVNTLNPKKTSHHAFPSHASLLSTQEKDDQQLPTDLAALISTDEKSLLTDTLIPLLPFMFFFHQVSRYATPFIVILSCLSFLSLFFWSFFFCFVPLLAIYKLRINDARLIPPFSSRFWLIYLLSDAATGPPSNPEESQCSFVHVYE